MSDAWCPPCFAVRRPYRTINRKPNLNGRKPAGFGNPPRKIILATNQELEPADPMPPMIPVDFPEKNSCALNALPQIKNSCQELTKYNNLLASQFHKDNRKGKGVMGSVGLYARIQIVLVLKKSDVYLRYFIKRRYPEKVV